MADNDNGAAPAAPSNTPDPSKTYRLTLARAIEVAPKIWARPGMEATVKGSLIAGFGDAVISFEEV